MNRPILILAMFLGSSAIGVGTAHAQSSGAVVVWGGNQFGQLDVPTAAQSGVTAVGAGWGYIAALKEDGSVIGWGNNAQGQTNVPVGAKNGIRAIAAGYFHMLALKNDGSVVAWGANDQGQTNVPGEATNGVVAVAAGYFHSVALKGDGSVVAWGWNFEGQSTVPTAAKSGVVAIAAGVGYTAALKGDGSVVTWGRSSVVPVPVAAQSGVTAIAAAGWVVLALKDNGSVVAWGDSAPVGVPVGALSGVRVIAGGLNHALAINTNGFVIGWGDNLDDETTIPEGLRGASAVAAGTYNSVAIVTPIGPSITHAPRGQSLKAGQPLAMSVQATGFPLNYQWQRNGANIVGATHATNYFGLADANLAGAYTVVVSNSAGSVTSAPPANVSVLVYPPVITAPPASQAVEPGEYAAFHFSASGSLLNYQWRKDGVDIPGASGATNTIYTTNQLGPVQFDYYLGQVQPSQAGAYTVVVSNSAGSVTSAPPAVLTVALQPPLITTPPVSQEAEVGQPVSFTFRATGSQLHYQWQKNGADIPGASGNGTNTLRELQGSYNLGPAQISQAGEYTVMVSNAVGSVTSAPPAVLTVVVRPVVITVPPASQTVQAGRSASFSVTATGSLLSYQWRRDGVEIPGATGSTLNLSPAQALQGEYSVVVSNPGGSVTSAPPAVLTVNGADVPHSGAVLAWGGSLGNESNVPAAALSDVIAIAAGGHHTLALKSDGTVLAWGFGQSGQTSVPAGLGGVTGIAAGPEHSVALKNDGSVVMWGAAGTSVPGPAQSGVTAIAAGGNFTAALKSDGTVLAWGANYNGQTVVPTGLNGVTAIAAGTFHMVALKSDGTVVAWGGNNNGGADHGQTTVPAGLTGVIAISAGLYSTMALKSDGTVVVWGSIAPPPAGLSGVIAISTGYDFAMALKTDGSVVAWGFGGGTVPATAQTGVIAISAGWTHSVALVIPSTPSIQIPPASQTVELGHGASFNVTATGYPLNYRWRKDGIDIPNAAGVGYFPFISQFSQGGEYTVVVANSAGSVTSAPPALLTVTAFPVVITAPPVSQTVSQGKSGSFSVAATGSLLSYQWCYNGIDIPGATGSTFNLGPVQASMAGEYTVVVSNLLGSVTSAPAALSVSPNSQAAAGAVRVWGIGNFGVKNVPLAAHDGVIAMAAGRGIAQNHMVALTGGGAVVAWGNDDYGQIDVPLGAQTGVAAIAAGQNFTVALKSNGSVLAWGNDDYGQIDVPSEALSGATAIAAGTGHTVVLKNDGSVLEWGGLSASDVPPEGMTGVTAVAAGYFFTVALKSNGSVLAWGNEDFGQSDVPVAAQSGVVAIAGGERHVVALKSDGSVVAWGANDYGQSNVPEAARSGVTSIAAGAFHTVALKNDGSIVAWGWNNYGQCSTPAGLSSLSAIAAGGANTMALVIPSAPAIAAPPVSRTALAGQNASFYVAATGFPLNYQWRKDGIDIPGATGAAFNLGPAQAAQAGEYTVVVSNSLGSVTNAPPAVLKVAPAPAAGAVVAWGNNDNAQTSIPKELFSGVTAVAGGAYNSIALTTDGRAVAWGDNGNGQTDVPAAAQSGVVAVSIGQMVGAALKATGSVVVWGGLTETPAAARSNVAAIAVNPLYQQVFALKTDGSVIYFDSNNQEYSAGDSAREGVIAIAIGNNNRYFLKGDGSVMQWYQDGWFGTVWETMVVTNGAIAIAAGANHAMALLDDGSVLALGNNAYGQTDIPDAARTGVVAIAAGENFSMALKADGTLLAWGNNDFGQTDTPVGFSATAIAAGSWHSLALAVPVTPSIVSSPANQAVDEWQTAAFTVRASGFPLSYQWRKDGVDIPGATGSTFYASSARVDQAGAYTVVVSNSLGSVTNAAPAMLTINPAQPGAVVTWGPVWNGAAYVPDSVPRAAQSGVTAIAAVYNQSFAVKSDGTVVPWGYVSGGSGFVPATVPEGLTGVIAFASGFYHTVALKSDGTLVAWGTVWNGSARIPATVPAGLSGVTAIAASGYQTIAVKRDGTVVAWGFVWNGTGYVSATVPAGLSGVTAVAAGWNHAVALKTDGTVATWGMVWNGANIPATAPTGLTGVTAIAAGGYQTLAAKSDGTVTGWGYVFNGNGNAPATVPAGLQGVTAVAAGWNHAVALKSDGTIATWGTIYNGTGYVPATAPAGLTGVTAIAASDSRTVVLLNGVPLLPVLQASASIDGLTLSWPATADGFKLQFTASLEAPVHWIDSTTTPTSAGGRLSITTSLGGKTQLYRLVK